MHNKTHQDEARLRPHIRRSDHGRELPLARLERPVTAAAATASRCRCCFRRLAPAPSDVLGPTAGGRRGAAGLHDGVDDAFDLCLGGAVKEGARSGERPLVCTVGVGPNRLLSTNRHTSSSRHSALPKKSEATGWRTMTPPLGSQGTARGLSRNDTRCSSPLGPLSWPSTTAST